MSNWVTADPHFDHFNIIKPSYCDRPYKDKDGTPNVQMMNEALISNWNERVKPGDTTYLLGDVAFGPKRNLAGFRKQLNGRIVLIRGNHDPAEDYCLQAGFDEVHQRLYRKVDGLDLCMTHRPLLADEWAKHGAMLVLCGHVHELWRFSEPNINVGVDVWNYRPISLEEILTALPKAK